MAQAVYAIHIRTLCDDPRTLTPLAIHGFPVLRTDQNIRPDFTVSFRDMRLGGAMAGPASACKNQYKSNAYVSMGMPDA